MRKDWIVARERAANILRHFKAGMGIAEIAALYGISYMRVHQIVTPVYGPRRKKQQDGVGKQTLRKQRVIKRVSGH